jgi:phosphoribosylformylglycinamidine (FGAM) synthase-like enzyme
MEITAKTAEQLRLTADEFELIKQKLGRTPNFTELCAFSGMWSEHCSYKNSIKWLKTLPRDGGRMLVAAGEENAGLMDMGNGFGVVFKIESHNHPAPLNLSRARQQALVESSVIFLPWAQDPSLHSTVSVSEI